jgi:hypothetical protein
MLHRIATWPKSSAPGVGIHGSDRKGRSDLEHYGRGCWSSQCHHYSHVASAVQQKSRKQMSSLETSSNSLLGGIRSMKDRSEVIW